MSERFPLRFFFPCEKIERLERGAAQAERLHFRLQDEGGERLVVASIRLFSVVQENSECSILTARTVDESHKSKCCVERTLRNLVAVATAGLT